jgi:transcriptional repressor NF-X1
MIITCECQNLKQEVKCLASKTNESSPQRKSLECNDECLRLQRNHKLAVALNISSDHLDDHIPYSSTTLELFKNNVKWGQTQEREFRVFAADDSEKRLRFKPMPSNQRAFLHSLAEDFGLDSESMDPEPHRHVAIFKTPRFVSAPMKTLAQCLKIKSIEQPTPAAASTVQTTEPFNALLLSNPRFALTIDELRSQLQADLSTAPELSFNISFLPSEEIVLHPSSTSTSTPDTISSTLTRLKPLLSKTITTHSLASNVALCRVDASLNVTRREDDAKSNGGWSQVVKGAPKMVVRRADWGVGVGGKNGFTVLGTKKVGEKEKGDGERETEWKRKREAVRGREETVVENWESVVEE